MKVRTIMLKGLIALYFTLNFIQRLEFPEGYGNDICHIQGRRFFEKRSTSK
jgi:hypothetical protein